MKVFRARDETKDEKRNPKPNSGKTLMALTKREKEQNPEPAARETLMRMPISSKHTQIEKLLR